MWQPVASSSQERLLVMFGVVSFTEEEQSPFFKIMPFLTATPLCVPVKSTLKREPEQL